jgi:hypothetical protein
VYECTKYFRLRFRTVELYKECGILSICPCELKFKRLKSEVLTKDTVEELLPLVVSTVPDIHVRANVLHAYPNVYAYLHKVQT